MKTHTINNISFQKKLVAKCSVKDNKKQIPCKIYNLEKGDENYLVDLGRNKGWENNELIEPINFDINSGYIERMYVLEDNMGKCLGYMEIDKNKYEDKNQLYGIEVKPKYQSREGKINKNYVGETMLNFFVQMSKKMHKDEVYIIYSLPEAHGFYEKYGFKPFGFFKSNYKLSVEDGKYLKELNFKHTGSRIKFIV